jgi:hypothetical protein
MADDSCGEIDLTGSTAPTTISETAEENPMSRAIDSTIGRIRTRVHRLLHDDVINETIVVMTELSEALSELVGSMKNDGSALTEKQKSELISILLPLTSESIREALHKEELFITNGIVRSKNRILTALGQPIPDGHAEIDPNDFRGYNW